MFVSFGEFFGLFDDLDENFMLHEIFAEQARIKNIRKGFGEVLETPQREFVAFFDASSKL